MSKKLTHEEVNYRKATFKKRKCATCSMYIEQVPMDCTLVEQPIKPGDLCDRWVENRER